MDLNKAYDCLPYDLPIAKFGAYCLDNKALALIIDYLTNRPQRENGSTFSSYLEILGVVSQGSTLGPILFNLFIMILCFS